MSVQHLYLAGELHDDTEEDLVGADWHQDGIFTTVDSLRDVAVEAGLPWHVGNQLTLVTSRPDGTPWRPSPDVMVHPFAGPEKRDDMTVAADGIPALIIEVASRTTWQYDIDTRQGKAWGYGHLGVANYLVFDPGSDFLGAPCLGWQHDGKRFREWRAALDDRFHVSGLGIALRPENGLLRVFDASGRPVPFGHEKTTVMEKQARQLVAQAQRLAELEAELARLRLRERDSGSGATD